MISTINGRPYLLLSPSAAEEFKLVPQSGTPDCVVLGLYPDAFDYQRLNTAFRILKGEPLQAGKSKDAVLIAPHRATFHQAAANDEFPEGLSLGIGAYVAALESAAGVQAEVVGKPTKGFYELAIGMMRGKYGALGVVGIVGDDIENDLGAGAKELGLERVLGWVLKGFANSSEDGQI